ncbi:MAG TPA: hypothetical protein VMN36_01925 [Verrucomicrobiales bacterium]|nr:hypothetical protein [Verrucomicrobiales bacterium]
MRKWQKRSLSAALGASLGLLFGFGIGSLLDPRHAPETMPLSPAAPPPSQPGQRKSSFLEERNREEQALAEAASRASRTHKWLWLATQAESARADEMPRLVRLAAGDSELIRMLAARWTELDPAHMLTTLLADIRSSKQTIPEGGRLMHELIQSWGESDPQLLAKALSDDSLFAGYEDFRLTGAGIIMEQDPGLGLRLLTEWGIRNSTPSMNKVGEWAAADPAAAADLIGQMTNSLARRWAMDGVAEVWAAADPQEALDYANTLAGSSREELSGAVMKHWAKQDLARAIDYASSQNDPAVLSGLSAPLVAEWAKSDPAAALAWSQEHLPAPARVRAVGSLVSAVASDDLGTGADLVASLPPGGAKNQAIIALTDAWVKQPALDVNALGAWLAGLDDDAARIRALDSAQWGWIRENPDSAKAFVASDYGDLAGDHMLRQLATHEVRADPQGALDWAQSLEGEQAQRAQTLVMEQWYSAHPDAAIQWVTRQAEGDLRDQAIQGISRSAAFAGEDRLQAWADALDPSERLLARQTLEAMRLAPRYAETVEKVFGE